MLWKLLNKNWCYISLSWHLPDILIYAANFQKFVTSTMLFANILLNYLTLTLTFYFWIEAKMQYNCLYKQITYNYEMTINRIINLTLTKWTTKIEEQKDIASKLYKYWLCYLFKHLKFETSLQKLYHKNSL